MYCFTWITRESMREALCLLTPIARYKEGSALPCVERIESFSHASARKCAVLPRYTTGLFAQDTGGFYVENNISQHGQ